MRGQVLFSLIMGTSAGLMLYVLGSLGIFPDGKTYAIAFGAWFGFAELIPYVGPAVGAFPPVVIAALSDNPIDAVWLIIAFTALQQLEGHVVAPNVFGQALRINPILVIFALLLGGQIAGFVGAFISLPIAAIVRETIVYLRRHLEFQQLGPAGGAGTARGRRTALPGVRRDGGRRRAGVPGLRDRARRPRRSGRRGGVRARMNVTGLGKRFGDKQALRDISLSTSAGERVAIIGPNGAGKTTLLQMIAGTLTPDEGTLDVPDAGWVPQRAAVYAKLTVRENLRLFARLERAATRAVERMLTHDRARARTPRPASSPAATASGSTSPSGCWAIRRCCCSTSRAPRWTRRSASGCGPSSRRWRRRCSSRPTTSARPRATPTACSCWRTARSLGELAPSGDLETAFLDLCAGS